MKKYFLDDFLRYESIIRNFYPLSKINLNDEHIKETITYIMKLIELLDRFQGSKDLKFKEYFPEVQYTLDSILISLPIFRKKIIYLLIRNLFEATVNSVLKYSNHPISDSFRDKKDAVKSTEFYKLNKVNIDIIFNKYSEFSGIIHFEGKEFKKSYLVEKLEREDDLSDWKQLNISLKTIFDIYLSLMNKDEKCFDTSTKIFLQDILSSKEYKLIVNI